MAEIPEIPEIGRPLPEMTDEELLDALNPIVRSSINANYYRVLGMSSLPFNIKDVERFIRLNAEGRGEFYGEIEDRTTRDRGIWFVWKDCDVSKGHGVTFSMNVFGLTNGINSTFVRTGFYKMYLIRSRIESLMGLKPYTLTLLR